MTSKRPRRTAKTVSDFANAMESIAPTALAQEWDNVGLLAGDAASCLKRAMLAIDLTDAVVDEAIAEKADVVMAYHPPIFRPVGRLLAHSEGTDSLVYRCIRHGIAIYSTHTAMDAADGGTNDVMAALCGVKRAEPLEYVGRPGGNMCKLVVFVPADDEQRVADAMFAAGAGHIGDYSHCSYRLAGCGSFLGGASTNPTVGERGALEFVQETRLEVVVPKRDVPQVVQAMRDAHSYEEPAFDIYSIEAEPTPGIGRHGQLAKPVALGALARRLKKATGAAHVQVVGKASRVVRHAVVVVGAAGSLPFKKTLGEEDVIITGEIRHHDALAFGRAGAAAVALGHWASERPTLTPLAARLAEALPGVRVTVSAADADPFGAV